MPVIVAFVWTFVTCRMYPPDGLRQKRPLLYTLILAMHFLGMAAVLLCEVAVPVEYQISPVILIFALPYWWHSVRECISHIYLSLSTPGDTLP